MLYEILYLLSFKAENECLSADELAPKIPVHTDRSFINTYIERKLKRQNEIHLFIYLSLPSSMIPNVAG